MFGYNFDKKEMFNPLENVKYVQFCEAGCNGIRDAVHRLAEPAHCRKDANNRWHMVFDTVWLGSVIMQPYDHDSENGRIKRGNVKGYYRIEGNTIFISGSY